MPLDLLAEERLFLVGFNQSGVSVQGGLSLSAPLGNAGDEVGDDLGQSKEVLVRSWDEGHPGLPPGFFRGIVKARQEAEGGTRGGDDALPAPAPPLLSLPPADSGAVERIAPGARAVAQLTAAADGAASLSRSLVLEDDSDCSPIRVYRTRSPRHSSTVSNARYFDTLVTPPSG
ncbi:MAG: hypothetical protein HYV63_30195 [Candidatus Schekmanbacteria bacterium]|nr:hypothetical protein [Candidatus Schekmanbacteria bacterium]